jgi:hypothetical protein
MEAFPLNNLFSGSWSWMKCTVEGSVLFVVLDDYDGEKCHFFIAGPELK